MVDSQLSRRRELSKVRPHNALTLRIIRFVGNHVVVMSVKHVLNSDKSHGRAHFTFNFTQFFCVFDYDCIALTECFSHDVLMKPIVPVLRRSLMMPKAEHEKPSKRPNSEPWASLSSEVSLCIYCCCILACMCCMCLYLLLSLTTTQACNFDEHSWSVHLWFNWLGHHGLVCAPHTSPWLV